MSLSKAALGNIMTKRRQNRLSFGYTNSKDSLARKKFSHVSVWNDCVGKQGVGKKISG